MTTSGDFHRREGVRVALFLDIHRLAAKLWSQHYGESEDFDRG